MLTKSLQPTRHILAGIGRKIHWASKPIPCFRFEKIGFDQGAISCTELCERRFRDSRIIEFECATEDKIFDHPGIYVEFPRDVGPNSLGSTRTRWF
jgi:hypothetical protein